ncbi:hypothetical protein GCM10020367_70580 [Streptomyces sannanensis]|uniref:MarR family transcriptional regulator n=1 Tax=Streptomyces sannanensis TaxID=285536 RepID=A0ABP6SNQ4_9ACTN
MAIDPWVDVTMTDGSPGRLGLAGLLAEAHRIEALAVGMPPAECGLLRILYALGLRAAGWRR